MPSGGHGGSISHGGYHSSGSHSSTPVRIVPIVIGNRYYVNTGNVKKATKMGNVASLFFMVAFITILFSFVTLMNTISRRENNEKYLEYIERANEDSSYIHDGVITSIQYDDYAKKYYFTYSLKMDGSYSLDDGYTYAIYSKEYVYDTYKVGDVISFACSDKVVSSTTDSINFDYADFSLSDDGEYVSSMHLYPILFYVGCGCIIVGVAIILYQKNFLKKNQEEIKDYDHSDSDTKHCVYCGSVIQEGATKCDTCGVEF